MTGNEAAVTGHYAAYGVLERIREALAAEGHDPDAVEPETLAPVDEFHIGGVPATDLVLERVGVGPGEVLLDIGSGVGGPARRAARRTGAQVVGVDLTPAFVDAARALTRMCGMAGSGVRFEVGSATALPVADASVDGAMMLHVGMNIPDKDGVMREARRVLKPGRRFVVYDVMQVGPGVPAFPVPWAEDAGASALARPVDYRAAAKAAGLGIEAEEDRREAAMGFFEAIRARAAAEGPPRIGLHTLMGPTVQAKTQNMMAALQAGVIAPVLMVLRAPG